MKIERIDDNKIKVTISLTDLQERNIDLRSLNYNSPATQELFWDMMEQAEVELGFDTSESQLCIEAYPDSDEGFTVTITKLDQDGEFESIQKYIKSKYTKKDLHSKKRSKKICSSLLMYSFESLDDLCMLAKKIASMYIGESTLYKYKNAYYLLLTKNCFNVPNIKVLEHLIGEYGNKISNISFYEGYLNEYGQKIMSSNAIEILNNYF